MSDESARLDRSDACFGTTRWTLMDAVRSPDGQASASALAALCQCYWPPVYAYLRRTGRGRDEAAELTQGFFADVVIWRELFGQADRERGKARSLVLAALKRYVVDAHRRSASRGDGKRPEGVQEYLDREEALLDATGGESADTAFDRRWALLMVQRALNECEQHYAAAGKRGHWALFERRVLAEARGQAAEPLETAAPACGFPSAAAGAAAVQVVRVRFRAILDGLALDSGAADATGDLASMLGPVAG